MPVSISKKESRWGCRASTISAKGLTSSYASMNRSAVTGAPSTLIRSVIDCTCGEVYRPVRRSKALSRASTMRAVLVLPFVPVMWMDG